MSALRLEAIEKTFPDGTIAVGGVDLDVSPGELVVLLGPSGCGKSTLLRIVAGIEAPTAGRVLLHERDITDLPPQKRDIAMVFQNYALYPHMTVRENLAFGLRMRGEPREVVARRVAEVAESLGIAALLDRRPAQLSGGQRQRVALGRAIARNPKVFLLDEPLSNLDVQLRVTTRMELARLHRSLGVPMLYVTHDQEEAMTLGDRVVVLRAGRCLQVGAPLEIYARPATQFVGGFVGSPRMNFLPGRLERRDEKTHLLVLDTDIVLDGSPAEPSRRAPARDGGRAAPPESRPAGAGRDVVVGVRPEDLDIVSGSDAHLHVRVDVVEPLGKESLLHVFAPRPEGAEAVELRVLAPGGSTPRSGTTLGLRLRRDRLHLFDPASEERLAEPVVP